MNLKIMVFLILAIAGSGAAFANPPTEEAKPGPPNPGDIQKLIKEVEALKNRTKLLEGIIAHTIAGTTWIGDPTNLMGKPGKDGENGLDGKPGKDGINGTNGRDGQNGVGLIVGVGHYYQWQGARAGPSATTRGKAIYNGGPGCTEGQLWFVRAAGGLSQELQHIPPTQWFCIAE